MSRGFFLGGRQKSSLHPIPPHPPTEERRQGNWEGAEKKVGGQDGGEGVEPREGRSRGGCRRGQRAEGQGRREACPYVMATCTFQMLATEDVHFA